MENLTLPEQKKCRGRASVSPRLNGACGYTRQGLQGAASLCAPTVSLRLSTGVPYAEVLIGAIFVDSRMP